ncbi:hypothetical protein ACVWWG_000081 [Bradyrhizobium sp. LB7.2]
MDTVVALFVFGMLFTALGVAALEIAARRFSRLLTVSFRCKARRTHLTAR